ncbi:hypothetical protein ACOM2C_01195 [Pseudarthrobacter sp. So.54]
MLIGVCPLFSPVQAGEADIDLGYGGPGNVQRVVDDPGAGLFGPFIERSAGCRNDAGVPGRIG